MDVRSYELLGKGLYSVPQAHRLTNVPSATIRRWLEGYTYKRGQNLNVVDPLWKRDFANRIQDELVLSFRDLIEIQFVSAFRKFGVSYPKIRKAAEEASSVFGTDHPFSSIEFKTDGRSIFARLGESTGETKLLDLARSQFAFEQVISPSLYNSLIYDGLNGIEGWYPMWPKKRIIIHPEICFGQPIVAREGIPTSALYNSAMAEGSVERTAKLFNVSKESVEFSIEFEEKMAA